MLQPLIGIPCLIFFAWLLSVNRRGVKWRPVLVGLALQWILAVLILKTPAGAAFFDGAQTFFVGLINASYEGAKDVVGAAALGIGGGAPMLGALIFVSVIFFSSLFAVLHYTGIVRRVVGVMAKVMVKTMGTSGAESTSAAANIFVGQTEAPLLVRPYLAKMTSSELGAVMTVGYATVAGTVFGVYVAMLQGQVPGIAGHLLAASVMSAPMGLAIAKVVFPESQTPETLGEDIIQPKSEYANLVDAAAGGASDGVRLALNILGMLVAFLGILAVVNVVIGWTANHLAWSSTGHQVTLQELLGYAFAPIAWLLGIPADETLRVGSLLGTKMAVNEYVAFKELISFVADDNPLSERSRIISSYALCGFANVASIAIQIGGLGGIAPSRRSELARIGFRAMLAGALTSFITAATAALLLT